MSDPKEVVISGLDHDVQLRAAAVADMLGLTSAELLERATDIGVARMEAKVMLAARLGLASTRDHNVATNVAATYGPFARRRKRIGNTRGYSQLEFTAKVERLSRQLPDTSFRAIRLQGERMTDNSDSLTTLPSEALAGMRK